LGKQVRGPRPLWAAVKANEFAVGTVPREGQDCDSCARLWKTP